MHNIYRKFHLFILLLSILGCSNDDTNEILSKTDQLLLKQVKENGIVLKKFEYKNGLITSRENYNSGELWLTENFEYKNDTVVVKSYGSSGELIDIHKYYTISKNIQRRDKFDSEGVLINYWVYRFLDNSCGFIGLDIYNDNGILTSHSTFEYTDSNCSSESVMLDGNNQILWKEESIRDDKHQYNKSQLLDFFRGENLGNTSIYYRWNSQNDLEQDNSYNSIFEYNSSNFPVSEQRTYLNGKIKIFTFEYY